MTEINKNRLGKSDGEIASLWQEIRHETDIHLFHVNERATWVKLRELCGFFLVRSDEEPLEFYQIEAMQITRDVAATKAMENNKAVQSSDRRMDVLQAKLRALDKAMNS